MYQMTPPKPPEKGKKGLSFFQMLLVAAALIPVDGWLKAVIFLIPYFTVGYDVLWGAVRNIAHGQVFDEQFLMSIATIGAYASGEYLEAVAVMLLYQVGELFQGIAVGKSRKSISSLMDIRPDSATVLRDGAAEEMRSAILAAKSNLDSRARKFRLTVPCLRARPLLTPPRLRERVCRAILKRAIR